MQKAKFKVYLEDEPYCHDFALCLNSFGFEALNKASS